MISIPWPWHYTCPMIANLVAYVTFSAVFIPIIILITATIGPENGSSETFLKIRIILAAVVVPLTGLAWCFLYGWVGRRFMWYGLSSYTGQTVTHRTWPKTVGEIIFAISSILVSFLLLATCMICAVMFVLIFLNVGGEPSQLNGTILAMVILCILVTVFAMYVVASLETGWFGVCPPDKQMHHVTLDTENPFV